MKRIVVMMVLAFVFVVPSAFAQVDDGDRFQVSVFADYVRLKHANNANYWGIGGRFGGNLHPNVGLEGEVAFDFARDVNEDNLGVDLRRPNLKLLHAFFGPKFQTGNGPVRAFATIKGGFINFSGSGEDVGLGTALRLTDTQGAIYPAGGVEAYFGNFFGIRAEVGDLLYFDRGPDPDGPIANHNLRVTFGPTFRW